MKKRCKQEKSLDSSAPLQTVVLILALAFFSAISLSLAQDNLSGHSAPAAMPNSLIPLRYAVMDMGTNFFPMRISNGGWVIGGSAYAFSQNYLRWHQGILETLNGVGSESLYGVDSIDDAGD